MFFRTFGPIFDRFEMNMTEKYLHRLQQIASYVIPLAIFWCVSALCFAPQFEGRVLPQHDIEQYNGMSRDLRQHYQQTGSDAQWTGAMFGGMPAYLISVRYPSQLVKNTVGQVVKAVKTPAGFIFFAMTAMWLMMLMLGVSPWAAVVPALAYGLSTYFFLIIGAGHVTKMWALVYAPLMCGGIFTALRGNMWAGAVATALFASLEIGANHPQITYYFLLAAGIFWVNELIFALREKHTADFAKRTVVLIAAGIVAAGSNFAPLWYTSQHSPDTIRGGSELSVSAANDSDSRGLDLDYATAWSYGIAESWNMLIPDFAGGDSSKAFDANGPVAEALAPYGLRQAARQLPAYWGGQPYTAGPTYLGAAAIFFALLGLMMIRSRDRWWIMVAMVLTLLLAWGRNFMGFTELCFKYLPMYDKFRTVSMTLVVWEWAVPLLAGAAIWKMWRSSEDERRPMLRKIAWAAGIAGGICLLFIVAGGALFDFGESQSEEDMTLQFYYMLRASGADDAIAHGLHEQLGFETAAAMTAERIRIMQADAWRSLLFILLAAGAAALFAWRKTGGTVTVAAAAVLITVDLAFVDMRFLPHDRFVSERKTKPAISAADAEILKDTDDGYRVYNLTVSPFNDATTSNLHRSIGGYHGAKLARYQDIIDRHLQSGRETPAVLDMLNTRYIIEPDGSVTRRESANGAAWFVENTVEVPSAADEIEALTRIDTKTTAVASPKMKSSSQRNEIPQGRYGSGEIRLAEYRPNYQRYEYTADTEVFAVFSEIFYNKGWNAYIDGNPRPAQYYRVDYILRGMELPAGRHTVEWKFAAPSWTAASAVTAVCSAIILAAAAAYAIFTATRKYRYERKRKQTA